MNFIEAVKLMCEEYEKDIAVYITREAYQCNETCDLKYRRIYLNSNGQIKNFASHPNDIYDYRYPYRPDPSEILATDWIVVKTEPIERLHNFEEALKALKEGKAIRRKKHFVYRGFSYDLYFKVEDYEAEDWIIERCYER